MLPDGLIFERRLHQGDKLFVLALSEDALEDILHWDSANSSQMVSLIVQPDSAPVPDASLSWCDPASRGINTPVYNTR